MIYLTFAKDIDGAKRKIDYVLGRVGSTAGDKTVHIEWETWNINWDGNFEKLERSKDVVKHIMAAWREVIEEKKKVMSFSSKRGRPFKKTAYHISLNEDLHIDYFSLMRKAIWKWIVLDFQPYMGLLAYHFKDVRFHIHMVINPISLWDGSVLRLSPKDVWWQNRYYIARDKAFLEALQKISQKAGLSMPYEKDVIGFSFDGTPYRDFFRKDSKTLLSQLKQMGEKERMKILLPLTKR